MNLIDTLKELNDKKLLIINDVKALAFDLNHKQEMSVFEGFIAPFFTTYGPSISYELEPTVSKEKSVSVNAIAKEIFNKHGLDAFFSIIPKPDTKILIQVTLSKMETEYDVPTLQL